MKTILIALTLTFILPAATFAGVNCSDVKSKNRDECVRAKRNNNDRDDIGRDGRNNVARGVARNNVDRGDLDDRRDNIDKDDVECRNAKDADVRRECLKRKY